MMVRRLVPTDAPAYRPLRLRALREHPEAFTSSYEEHVAAPLAETERRLASSTATLWGAFDDDKLCGAVGLDRETRTKARHKASLVAMYVAPEHGGRGIGHKLVDALVQEARGEGLELLVLTVTEGNHKAIQLYERAGFRSFGVEPRAIKVAGRAWAKNHMYLNLITTP
ncbi:MAG: GNAT family N-acetyltransferase [Haliea sp.]|nr:MAG: GNAT family N-acetyltransferase [Haliea sp.]